MRGSIALAVAPVATARAATRGEPLPRPQHTANLDPERPPSLRAEPKPPAPAASQERPDAPRALELSASIGGHIALGTAPKVACPASCGIKCP